MKTTKKHYLIEGQIFGDLKFIKETSRIRKDKSKKSGVRKERMAECKCVVCGAVGCVRLTSLVSGNTTSCRLFHNRVEHYDKTTKIFFHDGDFGLIDREDYFLIEGKPIVHEKENHGYVRILKDGKKILLHKLIMKQYNLYSKYTDHINRIPEDNRKENLRAVTQAQNMMNTSLRSGNKTSRYKGVHKRFDEKKWTARIFYNGEQIHIGRFENEIDAAIAYDIEANKLFGEFSCTNKMLGLI